MDYTIYSITCKILSVLSTYVGSTKSFVKRQYKHKFDSKDKTKAHIKL